MALLAAPMPAGPALAQSAAERPVQIVVLGDSLSAGFGISLQQAFPARLERALREKGHKVEVANAGVSGDTTTNGLARLDWSVPDGTDAVIVALGANDMLRGLDPQVARRALGEIVGRLKARNVAILLAGMRSAPNLGPDFGRAFERIYTDLATDPEIVFYPFFLDGVATEPKLNLPDGLHPNPAGVDRMVAGILPKAEELIARVRAQRGG